MKIGDYIVLGVILLWLVLAFCWMHRQKSVHPANAQTEEERQLHWMQWLCREKLQKM